MPQVDDGAHTGRIQLSRPLTRATGRSNAVGNNGTPAQRCPDIAVIRSHQSRLTKSIYRQLRLSGLRIGPDPIGSVRPNPWDWLAHIVSTAEQPRPNPVPERRLRLFLRKFGPSTETGAADSPTVAACEAKLASMRIAQKGSTHVSNGGLSAFPRKKIAHQRSPFLSKKPWGKSICATLPNVNGRGQRLQTRASDAGFRRRLQTQASDAGFRRRLQTQASDPPLRFAYSLQCTRRPQRPEPPEFSRRSRPLPETPH